MWQVCGERDANTVLVAKLGGTGQLRRTRHRGKDDVIFGVKEIGQVGVDWTNLAQNRYKWQALVHAALKLRFP